ncbi:MAG TPA: HAMP domain-containing sensor histidine kinase [Mucilaginibacter sp.]|jgi:signal transduction histidine kinase|nr:HAMP domain-containing sensor histidine kinase [Mucilaginibacter sp.]
MTNIYKERLGERWKKLTGNTSEFTLEARFFHSISLGAILLSLVYIPYNISAGLYMAAFSCLLFGCLFFYEYYRSRFRFKPYRGFVFGLAGLLVFSVNYFANSGIQGSTDLIWPAYLLLLLTISPYRQYLVWIISYIVVFALIHVTEHLYPTLVHYPFRPGKGQLIDRITAFPIPVITICIVIGMLRKSYDREHATVKRRDAEKSRLLSILSHDLRAPLIQIQQYLEVLSNPDLSGDDRLQMEETLNRANGQTLEMLTSLLYWSRSQQENANVSLTRLNLADNLSNTLAMAETLAAQKGIVFKCHIDPSLHAIGDTDMLQLVVRNLLQNAIKFTSPGGDVSIEAESDRGFTRIYVKDSGKGIAADDLEAILSGNTKPSFGTAGEKGVGLGLTLCREFMERQGGSITAESVFGEGSVFTIELPAG